MSRQIRVGDVLIGGGAPVSIQSMCSTKTEQTEETLAQIHALHRAGCQIVRVAVPHMEAAKSLGILCRESPIPVVADIHFDYRLALEAVRQGIHKIRINPGNIGSEDRVRAVAEACKSAGIPIRIGVNGGSLEKKLLEKYGGITAEALAESALTQAEALCRCGWEQICLSVKSSSVPVMMEAYRLLHQRCDFPLHLGVTEAGTARMGSLKAAMGIGGLLCSGIGDTLRVTLTEDPVEEIAVAKEILQIAGLRHERPDLVACPTCGRTEIDLIDLAREVERRLEHCEKPLTVAVMGCPVNGPGEAASADVGIAGGKGVGLVFRKGEIVAKVPQDQLVDELMRQIESL